MKDSNSALSWKRVVGWAVPFAIVEGAIVTYGFSVFSIRVSPIDVPSQWQNALLTISATVAVFAVNFSIFAYTSSPYKSQLNGLSRLHVVASVLVLLIALAPFIVFAFSPAWVATSALLAIPVLAYSTLLLSQIATYEASPSRLIERRASEKIVNIFTADFVKTAVKNRVGPPELSGSSRVAPPTHEMTWKPVPQIPEEDPFIFLRSLAGSAVSYNDIATFDLTLAAMLDGMKDVHSARSNFVGLDNQIAHGLVTNYVHDLFNSIGVQTTSKAENRPFVQRFLSRTSRYVLDISSRNDAMIEYSRNLLSSITSVVKRVLPEDYDSAVYPLAVARQWATRKLDAKEDISVQLDISLTNALSYCARVIQNLGEQAIKVEDSHYLHRCLDGLGWLGCAAVRRNEKWVGDACANGLVQLGRKSRSAEITCFWDRCALAPCDHALEHLKWMISETTKLDKDFRTAWAGSLGEAVSRLLGRTSTVKYETTPNGLRAEIKHTPDPHRFTIDDNGRVRTIDYSDPDEVKEFALYG